MPDATPSSPAHDFDFWVGEWDVFGPQGRQVGTNSITALFGTGALAEHWHGAGAIVMEGMAPGEEDGSAEHQRITWTPRDGGVRQLWEVSSDGGTTWRTAFDGRYVRRTS
jgi:hypothetical protein